MTWKRTLAIVIMPMTWGYNDAKTITVNGLTYGDYAEASKKVAYHYGFPFADTYGKTGFNKYTMGTGSNAVYSSDQLHPNATGAKRMTKVVLDVFVNELTVN
jgi:lysophospholipase L1-like esterase